MPAADAAKRPPLRSRFARVLSTFICLLLPGAAVAAPAQADFSDYGIDSVSASLSTMQAGAHPDFTTTVNLKTDPNNGLPFARTKEIRVASPPGLVGNPTAFPQCPMDQFSTIYFGLVPGPGQCPPDSQVGTVFVRTADIGQFLEPLYNLTPPTSGDSVARLGFIGAFYPVTIELRVRSESDYGLTAIVQASGQTLLTSATTTIWGIPADPSHDGERFSPTDVIPCGGPCNGPTPSGVSPVPFVSNPTRCDPMQVGFAAASFPNPDTFDTASASLPDISGCNSVPFDPSISLQPTAHQADSPNGLDVELHIPQPGLTEPTGGLRSADLKKAVVTLPEGMTLNPAAADDLGSCSEAEIGLFSSSPIRFDPDDPNCPNSSKVGTAKITTPLLADPLEGSLYLAKQDDNPFDSLLSGYLVAEGNGVTVKLAGRFDLDPQTGRITATFDNNPQQPFSDLELHFKGGSRGVLVTPPSCGTYQIQTQLVPWSATDPDNPTPAEIAERTTSFQVTSGPGGGPCPTGSFAPGFSAGTVNPVAGRFSPFVLRVSRGDGTQELSTIGAKLPEGLLAKLKGIPYCPDAALATIPTAVGTAAGQLAAPSCSAASQVGTVSVGAGAGSSPFYVKTGRAYLAGPYNGAPLSLAFVTPALAGPFDLGNVLVRAALHVDPLTAQVSAVSDALPTILHGIPLHLRDVRVDLDRSGFTLNPTSCDPMEIASTIAGVGGATAQPSSRFQVGSCGGLPFKPKLALRVLGKTGRNAKPRLRAVLTTKPGEANIRRAQVSLPHSEFLEQNHIKTICTRAQFSADSGHGDQCPPNSIYGHARAFSPLLDKPLEGPVYLRSSSHKLPDLVAALNGQIDITLAGRVDSGPNAGIRNTFEVVPDAPVSKFVLEMKGGRKGLLVNSENLCAKNAKRMAIVRFTGQNGKVAALRPTVGNSCKGR